ncbi:MAG TPA: LacI family DNA-binding transcriptional regulator [Balneolaceae bacterium]|nr:LacI family DNA-binding transcriptional regulator [Balneolaceae bacterium]
MRVTQSDIAEETGFSVSTVSRALRGIGNINKSDERLILETAKRLNYPLQQSAGSRLKKQNNFIALVTGFHTGEFYSSFFNGFVEAAEAKEQYVSLFSISADVDKVCSLLDDLREAGYSSAVLFVPGLHSDDYEKILEYVPDYFPLISCTNIDHPVMDTVTFDAYRGASLVAKHFIDRGYKSVGFIEGPVDKPEARFRKSGFIDVITHTEGTDFIWSYPGDYSLESGIRAFEQFKKLKKKPRAVFAANDATALGFMESARAEGYHFPNDIALAGYDNLPMCKYHFPNITSVNTNFTKLAKITLDTLTERQYNSIDHQGLVSLVPVDLKIRQSS